MDSDLFALVSMAARYWFCGLMLLIVFRAWHITFVDNKNARKLRKWSPETGCVGQFVVDPRSEKKRACLPIPKEGTLGSSGKSDIYVREKGVKRLHLTFEVREGGLLIKPRKGARVLLNDEFSSEALFARDGDTVTVGEVKLLLVMFGENGITDIEPDDEDLEEFENSLWPDE
ncbi:MAG: FHA domain-containing protein [Clostridia bacterium]|nr:FHA domain-containing protein [Clostridia bacterium]